MPVYLYKAKTPKGNIERGSIEVLNKDIAIESLQKRGLIVVSVKEAESTLRARKKKWKKRFRHRLRYDDLASVARQLATLLDAGVPLLRSLDIVKEQAEVKSLYVALESIVKDIESGEHLSAAIAKHPKIFSQFWVHLISTGETSGQLPFVLAQLAQYTESAASLQRKVLSALIYPIVLSFAATIALVVFITVVVPMFARLYSYFGADLPVLTRIVLNLSLIVKKFFFLIFLGLLAVFFLIMKFKSTERGKTLIDSFKIRFPLLRILFYNLTLYRFSSGLSMLLKSGVPILYSLEVVAKATASKIYDIIIREAKEKVKEGESLGATLEVFPQEFPPFVVNMIKVGEESGNLPVMLNHIARYYQEKVDTAIARLPYIVEPLIILTIGGVIAIIVIGMFLPIFGIATAVHM